MHQLLTAGTVLASYTDMQRMLKFASAALSTIPGVSRCSMYRGERAGGSEPSDYPVYEVAVETVNQQYGTVALAVENEAVFQPYAAAVHNIAGLVAMRIENHEHERELQAEVQKKTADLEHMNESLRTSLEERELLLREIHHRVKNNLMVVESLLKLQFGPIGHEGVQKALHESVERIRSMALVHKLLYESKTLDGVNFRSFVTNIIAELSATAAETRTSVGIEAVIDDISVDIDAAIPVSLIINELLTNALKYAFPDGRSGTVRIIARAPEAGVNELIVEDDGVGLPPDFSLETADTLGMQLISGLAAQIRGDLELQCTGGTRCTVRFPA
jgi:two-component sensor histidine kinase